MVPLISHGLTRLSLSQVADQQLCELASLCLHQHRLRFVIDVVITNQDSTSSRLLPASSYSCCIRNLHALVHKQCHPVHITTAHEILQRRQWQLCLQVSCVSILNKLKIRQLSPLMHCLSFDVLGRTCCRNTEKMLYDKIGRTRMKISTGVKPSTRGAA
jgi:hypothetical protein